MARKKGAADEEGRPTYPIYLLFYLISRDKERMDKG